MIAREFNVVGFSGHFFNILETIKSDFALFVAFSDLRQGVCNGSLWLIVAANSIWKPFLRYEKCVCIHSFIGITRVSEKDN